MRVIVLVLGIVIVRVIVLDRDRVLGRAFDIVIVCVRAVVPVIVPCSCYCVYVVLFVIAFVLLFL